MNLQEKYLFADIVYSILSHLNKDDSFNFINICKSVIKHKYYLYKKYVFNHHAITPTNKFMHHIESIKSTRIIDFGTIEFNNLTTFKLYLDSSYKKTSNSNINLQFAINNLPETLLKLIIHYDHLNMKLTALPMNLKTLDIFSTVFNQPLDNLPLFLENLHIVSGVFLQSLDKLPNNLQNLYINSSIFNYSLNNLPETLKALNLFCHTQNHQIDLKYLLNLISLRIDNKSDVPHAFPDNLTELYISNNYIESFYKLGNLPNALKILRISSTIFNNPLNNLPDTLECLILISDKFNQSLDNLPNLRRLVICSRTFNKSVDKLPETLRELHISSRYFNQSLNNLPKKLEILRIFSNDFNKSINKLPNNLEILKLFSNDFNNDFNNTIYNLPNNLQTLILGSDNFGQSLFNLPISLKTKEISFSSHNYWLHNEYYDGYYAMC